MQILITYPRTGTAWTKRRLRRFARLYRERGGEFIKVGHTHASYDPRFYNYSNHHTFRPDIRLFALIRDARKVVVSNWYWIQQHLDNEQFDRKEYKSLASYVPYGALRYADYLNWLGELNLSQYYFHEDIGTDAFVRKDIPVILGIEGYEPEEKLVSAVMKHGAEKVNLVGTDHSSVPKSLLDEIDSLMQVHCSFAPYMERYGYK